jgi:hypothetical protein
VLLRLAHAAMFEVLFFLEASRLGDGLDQVSQRLIDDLLDARIVMRLDLFSELLLVCDKLIDLVRLGASWD